MAMDIEIFDFTTEHQKTSFYNDMVQLNRPKLTNFMFYLHHKATEEATGATMCCNIINMFGNY